ncbi:MAG: hypothetical protein ACO3UU_11435, partial [Minisyncoccia bacterium]
TVINSSYDYNTGITTITAVDHGLSAEDPVKILGLQFECDNGSPSFPVSISTAFYNNITGITTITTSPNFNVFSGDRIRLENLVFECDSGGGPATALYPSGNNGYSFNVISTTEDKYVDAANLISLNRQEIIDKSLAQIAIGHSDFYFPNRDNIQTTRFSRFKDSYRLIQQNRTEIVNTAWDAAVLEYPSISTTELKCKRHHGYFVAAVSTDIFTGGNYYSSEFVKQYFDNGSPISNGLVGEESESVYAFTQARDLMKNAITNQLTVQDLTITADPLTGSNTSTESCANVQNAIDTLTTLITTVISEGSLDTLNQININNGIFFSGENKCRRDIGYIVDALIKDIKYGTNKHIREATRAYFNANGTPITNGLVGEEAPSVTAFNAIRDYAKLAITNNLNKKDLSITPDPITGDNTDPSSCANVQTTIDNLIGILTYHVLSGSLTSFPTLSVSNKIKVNVGVSTLPHTYVSGGTVTSKYTT